MNKGAILLQKDFFTPEQIAEIAAIARAHESQKANVHTSGIYSGIQWHQVNLEGHGYAWLDKLYAYLGIRAAEVSVFYYLSPGAKLDQHRDLTGASMNNRLRFHVPIITSDKVDFRVSGERIVMRPGECWCLDTSYLHGVENAGTETRVHIVIECDVNKQIQALLPPRDLADRIHSAYFMAMLGKKLIYALVYNSIHNPAYLKAQLGMVKRFIRWRILKLDTVNSALNSHTDRK